MAEKIQARIKGMHCASCSNRIERVVGKLAGVEQVSVNLANESMELSWRPEEISLPDVGARIADMGFEAVFPTPRPAQNNTVQLGISGMHCAACSARIERVTGKLDGVLKAEVNLPAESGVFSFDPEKINQRRIRQVIHDAGFETRLAEQGRSASALFEERQQEARERLAALKRRLIPAFCFAAPLLILSMGHMFGMPLPGWLAPETSPLAFALVQFLLTAPVMWAGRSFYLNGFPALWRRSPNMDSLVAVGTGAAFVYSVWNLIEIGLGVDAHARAMDLYFESAAVLIALISLGKYFEERSKLKTSYAIKGLMELAPDTATLVDAESGEQQEIGLEEIEAGDLLLVKPGERIPVDGTLVKGESNIDESMLTGEPIPVPKAPGEQVAAGSLNTTGALTMRAERVGADTTLARIIRLVEQAQGSKAPIANLADTISYYFVPAVMAVAVLSGLCWYFLGDASFAFSLRIFIAVMVIACPCAMGLATPTSIMVGTGRGAQLGVLIKSGDALQAAGELSTVLFDKTGTLTYGKPALAEMFTTGAGGVDEQELLRLAACAERVSEHPLAQAVVNAAHEQGTPLHDPEHFEAAPGHGVLARVDGRDVVLGNLRLMEQHGISGLEGADAHERAAKFSEQGWTALYVGIDGALGGVLAVADQLKPESAAVVARLRERGLRVIMLTGDTEVTARAIAAQAGVEEVIAGVLPEKKAETVVSLQQEGAKTAMVGDGVNDAPALAQADIGVAMGSGIDVAVESGDIVLVGASVSGVLTALELSKAVMRNIKQNLFWAFAFNTIGIPIAAGALYIWGGPTLNPMIAGTAMALSSVTVVTNALRLRFFAIK